MIVTTKFAEPSRHVWLECAPFHTPAPCFPPNNFSAAACCRYGAYGYPYEADFSRDDLSLIDRGWVVAVAHIRGGGEMGRRWYEDGKYMHKRNSFTDFIACAEHLIKVSQAVGSYVAGCHSGSLTAGHGMHERNSFTDSIAWARSM